MPTEREKMFEAILDSIPYKIVYVDTDFIIRFMNKTAKHHYYGMRGYRDLEGKSIFDCHNPTSVTRIREAVEKLKDHKNQIYLGVTPGNERFYINPVRDENGELIGFFERFEMNLQK